MKTSLTRLTILALAATCILTLAANLPSGPFPDLLKKGSLYFNKETKTLQISFIPTQNGKWEDVFQVPNNKHGAATFELTDWWLGGENEEAAYWRVFRSQSGLYETFAQAKSTSFHHRGMVLTEGDVLQAKLTFSTKNPPTMFAAGVFVQ